MRPWRQRSTEKLIEDRWISLRADECELPSGIVVSPYYVLEERDWVHVFAQNEAGRVLLVRQYRYAANAVCSELPGGIVDEGESPLDAARRELREETGHTAADWRLVSSVYANPARQTNSIHLFVARGLSRPSGQRLDDAEDIAIEFADVAAVKDMIRSGLFSQALHIASFYMALEATERRAGGDH